MDPKKSNDDGVLTLEKIQEAVDLLRKNSGMINPPVFMSHSSWKSLQKQLIGDLFEILKLEVGDWVFIDNVHVGEVVEVDIEDITTEYIVNVIESAAAKKPIVLRLTSQNVLMKVPKGSKLQSLLVLHGR